MVVVTGPQLNGTWLPWKSFHYPDPSGPKWAFSVPNDVANQLDSAYSLMIDILVGQFWVLVFSIVVAIILRMKKYNVNHPVFSDILPSLWNKDADLFGAVTETFIALVSKNDNVQSSIRLWVTMGIVLALYAGQKALSILVAPKIILSNAGPANPAAVYIPSNALNDSSTIAARFVLNVPWALRALGTATAAIATLSPYVSVIQEVQIGTFNGALVSGDVKQVTYNYTVKGSDMGLQRYPDLELSVTGSCYTEYSWYKGNASHNGEESCISGDGYFWFDNPDDVILMSALTGPAPVASFKLGEGGLPGALPASNATWAAIISSVGKQSFTQGGDPWYVTDTLTAQTQTSSSVAPYVVAPGRPALSCWEDNVWTYRGHSADVLHLGSLPGLDLSDGMKAVLSHYLSVPMVMEMSQYLDASALVSGSSALGGVIDAGASSFATDLERLVVAAYVATTNVLTTTTLYPYGASVKVANQVQSASGQVQDGVADFVVWSPDVAALDLRVVIVIPVLMAVIWLVAFLLLCVTPLGKAKALSAVELYFKIIKTHENADIEFKPWKGAEWIFRDGEPVVPAKIVPGAAAVAEADALAKADSVVVAEIPSDKV